MDNVFNTPVKFRDRGAKVRGAKFVRGESVCRRLECSRSLEQHSVRIRPVDRCRINSNCPPFLPYLCPSLSNPTPPLSPALRPPLFVSF